MVTLLMTQGEPLTADETQQFFEDVDSNGDGAIEEQEFMQLFV